MRSDDSTPLSPCLQEGTIVRDFFGHERTRIVVIRPAPIDDATERKEMWNFSHTSKHVVPVLSPLTTRPWLSHVIAMEMCQEDGIDANICAPESSNVISYPRCYGPRSVGVRTGNSSSS